MHTTHSLQLKQGRSSLGVVDGSLSLPLLSVQPHWMSSAGPRAPPAGTSFMGCWAQQRIAEAAAARFPLSALYSLLTPKIPTGRKQRQKEGKCLLSLLVQLSLTPGPIPLHSPHLQWGRCCPEHPSATWSVGDRDNGWWGHFSLARSGVPTSLWTLEVLLGVDLNDGSQLTQLELLTPQLLQHWVRVWALPLQLGYWDQIPIPCLENHFPQWGPTRLGPPPIQLPELIHHFLATPSMSATAAGVQGTQTSGQNCPFFDPG